MEKEVRCNFHFPSSGFGPFIFHKGRSSYLRLSSVLLPQWAGKENDGVEEDIPTTVSMAFSHFDN